MKLDDATRKSLQEYLSGKAHHSDMTPGTKRMLEVFLFADEHLEELDALTEAEEGDTTKLAILIEIKGELRTADSRAYVAARIRGEAKKRGLKRTEENALRRIRSFHRVTDLMHEDVMTQTEALELLLDSPGKFGVHKQSFETIRSDFQRGRDELGEFLEAIGFKVGPAFRKKQKLGKNK